MRRVALVLCVVLAACGVDGGRAWNGSGYVVQRGYDDPDDWTTYTPVCTIIGKYGCSAYMYIPAQHHDPAHWFVDVSDPVWGGTHSVEVDEATYNHCGDGKSFANGRCPS